MTSDRTSLAPGFRLLGEQPASCAVWMYRNITIVSWSGRPDVAAVRMIGAQARQALELNPGKSLSNVHLIADKVQLPDAATRNELQLLTKNYGAQTACVGVIIRGAGFIASAVRGIVTGLGAIGGPKPFEMRAFATIDDLMQWLPFEHTRRTGVPIDFEELRAALEHISSGLGRSSG